MEREHTESSWRHFAGKAVVPTKREERGAELVAMTTASVQEAERHHGSWFLCGNSGHP